MTPVSLGPPGPGTSVMQVMASDADDPTYGSSARLVYSVLDGEHHFTVDPKTGEGRGGARGGAVGRGQGRGGMRTTPDVCSEPSVPEALRTAQGAPCAQQESPGSRRGRGSQAGRWKD